MKRIHPTTSKAPGSITTGEVYTTSVIAGNEAPGVRVGRVYFAPGARTAWHSHATGEYLHVLEGTALVQERGGMITTLHAGDTVFTAPDVEHWHGAPPDSVMVHLAIWGAPLGNGNEAETHWGAHVSDEEASSEE